VTAALSVLNDRATRGGKKPRIVGDVLGERAAYLPAKTSVAVVGELPHGFGKGGLDLGADMNEVLGYALLFGYQRKRAGLRGKTGNRERRAGRYGDPAALLTPGERVKRPQQRFPLPWYIAVRPFARLRSSGD
jgi:hypothetical protein